MITENIKFGVSNDDERYKLSSDIEEAYKTRILDTFNIFIKQPIIVNLQQNVDDYFFNNGKEIKYFFIFNKDKRESLLKEIKKTKDVWRKFELEILLFWLSYNEKDTQKYAEHMTWEEFIKKILSKVKNTKPIPYVEISFTKNDADIVVIKNKLPKEKDMPKLIKSKEQDINLVFQSYKTILEETWVNKFYDINQAEYRITLIDQSNKGIWILYPYIDKFKSLNIFFHVGIYKSLHSTDLFKENYHYYGYLSINPHKIQINSDSRSLKIKKLFELDEGKTLKKLQTLFLKDDKEGKKIKKEKWDNKKTEEVGKEEMKEKKSFRIEDFYNLESKYKIPYLEFIKWINTLSYTEEVKNLAIKEIRDAYPIIGITISWRKDQYKDGHKQTPFFEIWETVVMSWLWSFLRRYDIKSFFSSDDDQISDAIEYDSVFFETKYFIKNITEHMSYIDKEISKKLRDRINNYSEVNIFWGEHILSK